EAYIHAGGDPSIDVFAACARTSLALRDDDRSAAIDHAEEVAGDARFFSPLIGWWALLKALDPDSGDAAVESVRASGEPAHYLARPYFFYADAVVLGRHGRAEDAMAQVARGDALLEGFESQRQTGRRWMAEAALLDGWGEPVTWAREALARFEAWDQPRPAAGCRSLLRRAGAPVPRRGRGTAPVPAELAALGVTSREIDVLALVAAGLSNREVAEELVVSVRTVENHVENLLAKTGARRRTGLAGVAARAGVGGSVT
ncbi:MAG TPA: LuxR C-terminal-related transcriptional regulator, partial [Acidimicrobiales bacterium]